MQTGGVRPGSGQGAGRDLSELDLHRPAVDEITFTDPDTGKEMRRIPEVIDCWFDSGAMPYAQLHYPFENKELFEQQPRPAGRARSAAPHRQSAPR